MSDRKSLDLSKQRNSVHNEGNVNQGFQSFDFDNVPQSKSEKSPSSLPPKYTEAEASKRKREILKNLIVVSFGFLLLFTAFQSISNLQSSINKIDGLGTASLAVIYSALVVSCMFVPTYMIKRLGLKYTLIVSMLMYSVYFVANFYAQFGTLIPASIILGFGGAPLWTSKCAYLTHIAGEYAELTSQTVSDLVVRFFGIFFMIFQSGQIWGNLISYYILKPSDGLNSSSDEPPLDMCGHPFDPRKLDKANSSAFEISDTKRYTLCGVYTGCALAAALLIFLLLDPLKRDKETQGKAPLTLLVETFKHLKNRHQLMIIPLTMFSGLEQAFIVGDFTQAYVTCAWGVHNVGFVMITFGVADAAFSMITGAIIKRIGRLPIFILGLLVNAAIIVVLFTWKPTSDQPVVFFLISGFWGMGDAVWQTQINAFYGVIFPDKEEAAFSNYRLWESLGFIIAFAYQDFLPVYIKLIVVAVFLAVGMTMYFVIEFEIRYRNK